VNTYTDNIRNKKQEPTDSNVLKLKVLTDMFTIFKIQNEINIVLNIVTAMQISKAGHILHFTAHSM